MRFSLKQVLQKAAFRLQTLPKLSFVPADLAVICVLHVDELLDVRIEGLLVLYFFQIPFPFVGPATGPGVALLEKVRKGWSKVKGGYRFEVGDRGALI